MRKVLFVLGHLSDLDVQWLSEVGVKEAIKAGQMLIEEGKPISSLYFVLDGEFSVRQQFRRGQEIARLCAGEILGEMSFVDAAPPSATVVAFRDSHVLRIARAELGKKMETDLGFAARFYRAVASFLSDRLRSALDELYGRPDDRPPPGVLEKDELDSNALYKLSLAGKRFEKLLKALKGE